MAERQINPNLRKLAELTHNPNLEIDKTMFEKEIEISYSNAPELKGMIYVPSVNLYFAKEKSLLGKNWLESQNELLSQASGSMPTPYQFKEFLKHLRDNPNKENIKIYNEITEVRVPWRAEWLNARFEKRKNGLYMISQNILENGKYKNIEQKLDNVLMKDKDPGISLDKWLNSNENHGLPESNIANGRLYYWYPRDKAVARFDADSGRADLGCGGDPGDSYSSLGVRVVVRPKGVSPKS